MQAVFDILEWLKIVAQLENYCQTGYGRLLVEPDSLFLDDVDAIRLTLTQVEETKRLIQRYGDVSLKESTDVAYLLDRLEKQGVIPSPQALSELLVSLQTLRHLARFFIQHRSKEETPMLLADLEEMTLPNTVIDKLESLVNAHGELHDSASERYGELNGKVKALQENLKQTLQRMVHNPRVAKYLQEPIYTERDHRYVLPVKSEHKVDVPGIVHGASATGSTLYIEPKSVVDFNNRIASTQADLLQEIQRILKVISEWLHPETPALQQFVNQAAQLDLLMAKARLSLALKANPVEIKDAPGILQLHQAKHPLLLVQDKAVVPNDILLMPPNAVLLITGPNTGGKTILLKLVGLFGLMMRAGLHLPVAEGSAMSLFDPILADIGDPQSIAQNLSTFSGHIGRLNNFLHQPNLSRGLILIDEICAGTDPQEGSALAKALLEAFHQRGATTIVTTHIGELKLFAYQRPGYLNASVEFDPASLSPTYRLILGVPGTSNALNIASRLGMADDIIDTARQLLIQPTTPDTASLIESLEQKNRDVLTEWETVKKLREEIAWEEDQLKKQLNRLEGEKRHTLQMFKEGLKDKLRGIERDVDDLKSAVQSAETAEKQEAQTVRKLADHYRRVQGNSQAIFYDETQQLYPQHSGLMWDSIQIGDTVESRSLNLMAVVIDKNAAKQELTLQAGILKSTVPFSDLIQKSAQKQSKQKTSIAKKGTVYRQSNVYSMSCDVRGYNSEDAIGLLDKFLDDALLSGVQSVNIIHGMGTGVLKKAIRAHLKELPYVKQYGPAQATDGGDGKTIVDLK